MEVVIPSPSSMDFDFNNSGRFSTYASLPSTPRRFGDYYFSAPTSPTRVSEFYREFSEFSASMAEGTSSSVPFEWEERPGTPKFGKSGDEFAFDFSAELEKKSLSAEELFDGGVIRPLKLPPRLQSPRSPRTPKSQVLSPKSPKHRRRQSGARVDPFEAAIENTRRQTQAGTERDTERERGRERLQSSNSGRRTARSHSPLRVSAYPWEEEDRRQLSSILEEQKSSLLSSKNSVSSTSSKKWSFKDLLLFRSTSEGSATDKNHPFRKYSGIFRRQEEARHSSFRSDSGGSGSVSRRRGPVSAHELHYTVNKAVSDDLKKKTFLPYKQGILGRLAFNPAVHALANGFGSLYRHHHHR
ncbi:hypothetical protein MLD38_000916 [Melastoma candidum]|uniref:Uncharacterized protein n=1 Tax=Melastoma candidum TaxID=119954 RepID=A0ACB9SBG6_9MYRT|nr:hypothetical protein MLD38_000916 [Melastoma candidum]